LIALLAKANKIMARTGRMSPIPFLDTSESPDNFGAYNINNNNKITFKTIFNLLITNCCCLLRYELIVSIESKLLIPKRKKINKSD